MSEVEPEDRVCALILNVRIAMTDLEPQIAIAPNLAQSVHEQLEDMITSGKYADNEIAKTARCSQRTVRRLRSHLRQFGTTKAPPNVAGRPKSITPVMLSALFDRLLEKPGMYQDEMVVFLWDEFETLVTTSIIGRALRAEGWTKKVIRQIAEEQNADLRDFHLYNLSAFSSYHLVFTDESGCDRRAGLRRTSWSPLGTAPVEVARFHREQRYQILPAYSQDGVVFHQIFQGSTDAQMFEDFLGRLLPHCGRWPEPRSVLVMDNASFHHSNRIYELCSDASVKLVYLPPYSPDFNLIEEFFVELKRFIKRHSQKEEDFAGFLKWCVQTVGAREASAKGHLQNAGIVIENL